MKAIKLFAILLVGRSVAWSACSGTSPNLVAPTWADVAACHTIAQNGDTITVSAGSHVATTPTTITKYVKIVPGGVVSITDNSCPGLCQQQAEGMLIITANSAGSTLFGAVGRGNGFNIITGTAYHV